MPYSHGFVPRRYIDAARPESWGLYSETEGRWLPVLFATKEEAAQAAMNMQFEKKFTKRWKSDD